MKKYINGIMDNAIHLEHGVVYSFIDDKGLITNFEYGLSLIDCLNILGRKGWELRLQNLSNQYILVKEI